MIINDVPKAAWACAAVFAMALSLLHPLANPPERDCQTEGPLMSWSNCAGNVKTPAARSIYYYVVCTSITEKASYKHTFEFIYGYYLT